MAQQLKHQTTSLTLANLAAVMVTERKSYEQHFPPAFAARIAFELAAVRLGYLPDHFSRQHL